MFRRTAQLIIFISYLFGSVVYADFQSQSLAAIAERIQPIGQVRIASEENHVMIQRVKQSKFNLGRAVFRSKCILCHGSGVAGAPVFGHRQDWAPRLVQAKTVLLEHVQQGYRAMPAKGACFECSKHDLQAAIDYMIHAIKK